MEKSSWLNVGPRNSFLPAFPNVYCAGTAKAAADGWALAEELTAAGGNVPAALAAWERRQLALGHDLLARCRAIGDSSQFLGTFRPGDPRLIFGLYGPGN